MVYGYYVNPEVLTAGNVIEISDSNDILDIEESGAMVIRGISKIYNLPLMITFYNQMQEVNVNIATAVEGFDEADYEKFNISLCQYMDSIELANKNSHIMASELAEKVNIRKFDLGNHRYKKGYQIL